MANCCSIKDAKQQEKIRRVEDVYRDEGLDGYYEEAPKQQQIDEALLHSRSLREKLQALLGIG